MTPQQQQIEAILRKHTREYQEGEGEYYETDIPRAAKELADTMGRHLPSSDLQKAAEEAAKARRPYSGNDMPTCVATLANRESFIAGYLAHAAQSPDVPTTKAFVPVSVNEALPEQEGVYYCVDRYLGCCVKFFDMQFHWHGADTTHWLRPVELPIAAEGSGKESIEWRARYSCTDQPDAHGRWAREGYYKGLRVIWIKRVTGKSDHRFVAQGFFPRNGSDDPLYTNIQASIEDSMKLAEQAFFKFRAALAMRPPLTDEQVMSGWQPIETAPRDGTVILRYNPRLKEFMTVGLDTKTKPLGDGRLFCWKGWSASYRDEDFTPHWQPLPEPPKGEDK